MSLSLQPEAVCKAWVVKALDRCASGSPSLGRWSYSASGGGVSRGLVHQWGKDEREIDMRIGAASALMQLLYRLVVVKKV